MDKNNKVEIFENKPVPTALAIMAVPTVVSQLITLVQMFQCLNRIF